MSTLERLRMAGKVAVVTARPAQPWTAIGRPDELSRFLREIYLTTSLIVI